MDDAAVAPAQCDVPACRLVDPSRDDFLPFVQRGEPVVVERFTDRLSEWSWRDLIARAKAAEAASGSTIAGEVVVSASGVVPDYNKESAPFGEDCASSRASSIVTFVKAELGLVDVLTRVSGESRDGEDHDVGGNARGGESATADGAAGAPAAPQPLLFPFERLYAYGKGWLLQDETLRGRASDVRPRFMSDADVVHDEAFVGGPGTGGGFCWVSSAGCLTPLHYDLSDGMLAQLIGTKRVWLVPPEEMDQAELRSSNRPGDNNWQRQSQGDLHCPPSDAGPALRPARRLVAELRPGDCLYIPSNWLHEVHTRTPSFSLGWRVAFRAASEGASDGAGDGGGRIERTLNQKLARLEGEVESGAKSNFDTLREAWLNPEVRQHMMENLMKNTGSSGAQEQAVALIESLVNRK